jgi:hypothetical protein
LHNTRHEVDLFDIPSLDKAFLQALAMERKVVPRILSPQDQVEPSNPGTSATIPSSGPQTSLAPPCNSPWCSFHKTNSQSSTYYLALKNLRMNKTFFVKISPPNSFATHEVVSLANPIEADPSPIFNECQ